MGILVSIQTPFLLESSHFEIKSTSRWAAAHFLFVRTDRKEYLLVERAVSGLGYEFVHLEWVPRSGLLRVYIDKPGGISVDDCARVSDHLSRLAAVEGIGYERLEVSSPGLDRPLGSERDFKRFRGHRVRLALRVPVNGRRTLTGTLGDCMDGTICVQADDKSTIVIDLGNVDKARLVPGL